MSRSELLIKARGCGNVILQQYRPVIDPTDTAGPSNSTSADHLQWETVKEKIIKAGTVDSLVDALFNQDGTGDTSHFNVFFATYRPFAQPFDILRLLLSKYDTVNKDRSERRNSAGDLLDPASSSAYNAWKSHTLDTVRSVLIFWMDMFPDDFREEPHYPCLTEVIEFCRVNSPHLKDVIRKAEKTKNIVTQPPPSNGLTELLDNYDGSLDYIMSPQRVRTPDVAGMDPLHVAEQLTYWDAASSECSSVSECSSTLICQQSSLPYMNIEQLEPNKIAEQMTFWDAELFRKLIPWQCQSYFWSKRNRSESDRKRVKSVRATVDLFNALLSRLQTSILHPPNMLVQHRAKIITRWIHVAVELRHLKNFSSLRAVLSGLQSEPIYRLKSTWALVSNEDKEEVKNLERLFTGEDGDEGGIGSGGVRRVLEAEGTTGKEIDTFLTSSSSNHHHHHNHHSSHHAGSRLHRRTKSDMGKQSQGTVPYLGTFLTDLNYVNEGFPDKVKDDKLINFEKRRKEFEVLAQLKLFQSAARQYRIKMDPNFIRWFQALPTLIEVDCYKRSVEIEPRISSTPEPQNKSVHPRKGNSLSRLLNTLNGSGSVENGEDSWTNLVPPNSATGSSSKNNTIGPITSLHRSSTVPTLPGLPHFTPPGVTAAESNGIYYTATTGSPAAAYGSGGNNSSLEPPEYIGSEFDPSRMFPISSTASSSSTPPRPPHQQQQNHQYRPSPHRPPSSSSGSDQLRITPFPQSHSVNSSSSNYPTPKRESQDSSSSATDSDPSHKILRVGLPAHLQPNNNNPSQHGGGEADGEALYKCIKMYEDDKLIELIRRALDKHLLVGAVGAEYCLVQLMADGREFELPDHAKPYYASVIGTDPNSILNFMLRKKGQKSTPHSLKDTDKGTMGGDNSPFSASTFGFKKKKRRRSNLMRWSSGFL